MGCAFNQQIIHPNQIPIKQNKRNKKEVIMTTKVINSNGNLGSKQNLSTATENIREMREPINGQALVLVQKAITKHFLFYGLSQNQKHDLIKLMRRYSAVKNQYIFQKGDLATTFFIIISGRVQIETGLQTPVFLQKGESFGELALIYDTSRSLSIVAREQTILWGIDSFIFNQFMRKLKVKNFAVIRNFLDKLSFFSFLSEQQKQNIVLSSNRFKYEAGNKIFRIKDPANSIFIVIEGRVETEIPGKPKVLFEKGQMFGQGCLLGDQFRSGTAWCIQQTECLSISKNSLLKELGVQSNNILHYCICKWALKRSSIFNLLKRTIVDKIIISGQMKMIQDGTIIEEKGKPSQRMYICLQGKINSSGVGSIYNQSPEQSGTEDLIKHQSGHIFTIKFSILTKLINRPLKTFVQTKQKRVKIKTQHMQTIDDFIIIQKISQNYISQKFVVKTHTKTKCKYFMECYKKSNIADTQQEIIYANVKSLKVIKQNPFIPNIIKVFNDNCYLFVVKQYTGTQTFSQLLQYRRQNGFTIDAQWMASMRFYTACVLDIITHLHNQHIIHRNINPQAFILGQNGYLYADKLNEMCLFIKQISTVKRICQAKKSKTIVDLPHYLAPETISGSGSSKKSDIWSFGVLIYEMLFGFVPFGSDCSDVMEIYSDIMKKKLIFPEENGDNYIIQKLLLTSILKIQEGQRTDLQQIKRSKLFQSINFKKLRNFQIKAPEYKIKRLLSFPSPVLKSLGQYFAAQKKNFREGKVGSWNNFDV